MDDPRPLASADWGTRTPCFEVLAFATIGVRVPTTSEGWEGFSHALWFCDALVAGEFHWYELAFSEFLAAPAGIEPYGLPPSQEAEAAVGPGIEVRRVVFGPMAIDQGDEVDFVERWMIVLADAARGALQRPDRSPAPRTWRS
jgi:serine/threonine-protein kinase